MRHHKYTARMVSAAVACLALTSCTTADTSKAPEKSKPDLPQYLAALPFESERDARMAALFDTKVLPIAVCALHDPKAAAKVTGQEVDSLSPRGEINECLLHTGQSVTKGWDFELTVGVRFDARDRQDSVTASIGGLRIYRTQSSSARCTFTYPYTPGLAIELSTQYSGISSEDKAAQKKGCVLGKKYVAEIAERWKNPPQRTEKATKPKLLLGMQSPCETMAEAIETVPPVPGKSKTVVSRYEPSECSVEDVVMENGLPDSRTRAGVSFEVEETPAELVRGSAAVGYESATIAGQPAAVLPPLRPEGLCEVTVRFGDVTFDTNEKSVEDGAKSQNVVVETRRCADAKKYAAVAVEGARS